MMIKKAIALTTLACFLLFSYSCAIYKWQRVEIESLKPEDKQAAKISAARLLSGEHIEFSKKPPAHIVGERILGEESADIRREIRISKSEIDQVERSEQGRVMRIKTKDGKEYGAGLVIKEEKDALLVRFDKRSFIIPLKDVKYIWIRKVDAISTLLLYVIPLVVFFGYTIPRLDVTPNLSF